MQTISIPYTVDDAGRKQLDELRRIQSAAIRTAYANAMTEDGKKVPEKDLRHLVKQRFAGGVCDAWLLHCATLDGIAKRKARPDGDIVFGGKKNLRRLSKKLTDSSQDCPPPWVGISRPFGRRGHPFPGPAHRRL